MAGVGRMIPSDAGRLNDVARVAALMNFMSRGVGILVRCFTARLALFQGILVLENSMKS
jgi:hypothetical protein